MQIATIGHNNPPTEIEILQQRLASYEDEAKAYAQLESKAVPKEIDSDELAGELTEHIKALKGLSGKIEAIHKKEKQPFWDAGKAADKWKTDYQTKIDKLTATATAPLLAWNRKKEEAERQRLAEIAAQEKAAADLLAAQAAAHEVAGINDTADELLGLAVKAENKAEFIEHKAETFRAHSRSATGAVSSNSKVKTGEVTNRDTLDLERLRKYFSDDALDKAVKAAARAGEQDIKGARIYETEKLNIR